MDASRIDALAVLVVDDCPDTCFTLRTLVALWGHEARTAPNGPAALEAAALFRPRVVILDLGLPGMDGFEVARRLRKVPGLEGAVVVACTGYAQAPYADRAKEAGIDRFLVKPLDLAELQAMLRQAAAPP